jgi:hypothetical protein
VDAPSDSAPPPEAVEYLKSNPDTWSQFKSTFGTLPDGFTPPAAPQEAVDYLNKNPNTSQQFQDTFGYLPPSVKGAQPFVDRGQGPQGPPTSYRDPATGKIITEPGAQPSPPAPSAQDAQNASTRAGLVDAWHKGGIAGARDYFLNTHPGQLVSALGGGPNQAKSTGPLDDAALMLTKNLASMGSAIMRLPELTWNYLGQTEPDDIKEQHGGLTPEQLREGQSPDVIGSAIKSTTSALADRFKEGERSMVDALSEQARAGIQKHMIDTAADGKWKLGEGLKDPYWWGDQVANMAPMIATDGASAVAAKSAYAAKFTQTLAKAAAERAPTSVARSAAQAAALRAAHQAAVVTNVGANGLLFGSQAADETHDAINSLTDETLMNYAPYRDLRAHGLSQNAAREQISTQGAFLAGITTAVTAGMGGEPLNQFMSKWASKIPAAASRLGAAGRAAVGGAAQGAAIGAGTQLGQNLAMTPITGGDIWENVLDSTVTNALIGGGLGGAVGAKMGPAAERGPQDVKDDIVSNKLKDYVTARQNFQAAQRAAMDPAVPIKHEDIQTAREDYQQASIALNQELLAQGRLEPAQQKSVAAALAEAQRHGIEMPETTYDHQQSGTLPGASAESREVGKPAEAGGDSEAGAATAKEPPSAGAGATAPLSGAEASRLDSLNKVANAEPLEGQQMHDLVANGLAKVTPAGLPVLLPEGRRLRASLVEKGTPAPEPVQPAAEKPSEAPAEKPKSDLPALGEGPLSPDEDPTLRLTGTDYGNLERLGMGKSVDPKDMVPLHQAGLVKTSDSEGGYSLLPAGRRELAAFQNTRQTSLERAVQPHLELDHGSTLTTANSEHARKLADIETAYKESSDKAKAVKQAAFDKAESARQSAKEADEARMRGNPQAQTPLQERYKGGMALQTAGDGLRSPLRKISLDDSLKGQDAQIQSRFAKQIERDPDKAVSDYSKIPESMGGKFVSTDIARELSPDYNKDRTRSSAVQEPASAVAKAMFERNLTRPLKKNEVPGVIMTGGGTGAGKTTGLQAAIKSDPKIRAARAFYDSNMADLDSTVRRIERVKATGNQAHILYTYRDPIKAWTDGVLKRSEAQRKQFGTGRTVPMDVHASTHADSNRVIHALATRYAGDDQVKIHVIDNSEGDGQAKEIPVTRLPVLDYNDIRSKLTNATESEHAAGRISAATYHGARGEPVPESRANSGERDQHNEGGSAAGREGAAQRSTVGLRGEPAAQPNGAGEALRENGSASRRVGEREAQVPNGSPEADGSQGPVMFRMPEEPLSGMPTTAKVNGFDYKFGPNETARDARKAYLKGAGIKYKPVTHFRYLDPDTGEAIAKAYDEMKDDPTDPKVKASYKALVGETKEQFKAIQKTGLKIEFIKPGQEDPYKASPRLGLIDVQRNNHLWVFPTEGGFGVLNEAKAEHPLLADSGITLDGRKLKNNDLFRVVHDYFGHIAEGNGFRAHGEYNAWRLHSRMYSPEAQGALASETLGQNAWVNFGPHAKANRTASAADTVYADQKTGLMDPKVYGGPEGSKAADHDYAAPPGSQTSFTDAADKIFARLTDKEAQAANFIVQQMKTRGGEAGGKVFNHLLQKGKWTEEQMHNVADAARARYWGDLMDVGKKAEPDNLMFKHFSDASEPNVTLDPEKYGTGLKGAEARRMANNKGLKTISAYAMGGEVEPELRGKTRYHIQVPRDEMYDLSADPEDFVGKNTDEYGNYDHSQAEKDIAAAGYRGYHLPGAEGILKGQARFFKPTEAFRSDVATRMPDKWTAEHVAAVKEHLSAEEQAQLRRDSAQRMVDVFHSLPDTKELAAAALAGKAKKGWYQKAAESIHAVFGGDAPRFSAVLAAMSPQTSVEMNFHNALRTFVNWDKAGRPQDPAAIKKIMGASVLGSKGEGSVLGAWFNNTVRALTSEDPEKLTLSGPKVSSFMKNLQGKTNEVTLDSWMAAFAKVNQQMFSGHLTQTGPGKSAGYLGFSAKVREAAKMLEKMTGDKWSPAEVQETVWSWAKAAYEHADQFGAMGSIPDMVKNGEITDALVKGTADFHSLFGRPEHSAVLGDSRFNRGLEQLRSQEGFDAVSGPSGEAEAAARSALSPSLHSAAERLETLRRERNAGAKGPGTDDDVPFRQGGNQIGMSKSDMRTALQDVQSHLGIPINLHDDHTTLPDYVFDTPGAARAQGMFIPDPDGGSVHLIGSNIPNAVEARATAIHEAVGHQGLRAMLGGRYGDVMDHIAVNFRDQVLDEARARGISVKTKAGLRYAAEEVVARASERVFAKDIEAQPTVWHKIVGFVRDQLRKLGLTHDWNETDLNNLLYASRDYVRSQWVDKMYARDKLAEQAGQDFFNPGGDNTPMMKLKGVPTGGNKDLESFIGKIGMTDKPLKQRWEDATRDIIARAETAIFDHFHGINRAENMAGISAADRGYKSASLSTNAGGLMRAILEDGHPVWRDKAGNEVSGRQSQPGDVHDVNIDPNEGGGHGLLDVFKPLGKDLNKWSAWMIARRAERLLGEGRENLFSPAEIAAAKQMGSPLFESVAKNYSEFKGKVLDWAQTAGIIDPESRAMWDHADYIPFYRIMDNGNMKPSAGNRGLGYVKNQIQRLRGGENNIGDPVQNIMTNFSNLIESGLRAHAARATVDNLEGSGFVTAIKGFKDPVTAMDRASFKAAHPQVAADLKAIGVDIDHMPDKAFRGMQKMLLAKAPPDEGAVSVWRGGQKEFWHVNDPVLFRSLQAISPTTWGPWMKLFSLPKRALTITSTLTPEFAASVGWKHMWQAFVQGRTDDAATPFTLGVDNVKGAIKFLTHDPSLIHARAQGGLFEGLGYDPKGAAQETRMTVQRAAGANVINTPRKAWLAYRSVIGVSENMNRMAIYDNALSSGMTPMQAAFEAKSTMDYHKRGNAQLARFIFDTVPFMGAHVSALHTLFKNATSSPQAAMRVAMRGALLSMASIAYVALNHNDPNYQALTDKDKASYWHFWLPSMGHFKIPKPFETGTIFATIPEAMMDASVTNADEPDRAWAALNLVGHSFLQEDSLSPRVAAVWPELELAMNKNTFNGSPILTQADQKVLPEEQDSPYVHSTYRWLANEMPDIAPSALRSPKQLQHLGQGYFGGVQDYVLAVTDALARRAQGEPEPAAGNHLPIFSRFFQEGPMAQTKYSNTMYDIADQAANVMGSVKKLSQSGTPESAARIDKLLEKNEDLVAADQPFSQAVKQVDDLRKQMREVQLSDMSANEKRDTLDQIQEAINETAKGVWDIRPGGKLSPSVAAELQGKTKDQQATTLQSAGLTHTAQLLRSLPATPPKAIMGNQ